MSIYHLDDIPDHLKSYFEPAPQLGMEAMPEEYVANMVEVFNLVRKLLADDGVLWLNLGDSYSSGGRASYDPSLVSKTTGVTNRPAGIRRPGAGLKPKDLVGIPWMTAFALRSAGWYLRQDIIWHKPNPMPESVSDRCTKAHEYLFLLSKSQKYYYDAAAIKEDSVTMDMRKPYAPGQIDYRGNGHDRGGGKIRNRTRKSGEGQDTEIGTKGCAGCDGTRNKRSVWTIPTTPYSGAHFATFPPALIEPCILAGSRTGDIVLDPFFGSGTTGQVAERLGRQWIGIELNENYCELQKERTKQCGLKL